MYVIREVVNCRPGKVGQMLDKFKAIGSAAIDEFFVLERKLMASPTLRDLMNGYHDLVSNGRREIYRVEG